MSKKIDANLIVAVGVLIASFGALFVYMRQASIMTEQTKILLEQTKANTWPHVSYGLSRTFDNDRLNDFKIIVSNKGVGPAIVNYCKLSYKDKPVETWKAFFESLDLKKGTRITFNNESMFEQVIAANDRVDFIHFTDSTMIKTIYPFLKHMSIEICYNSLHGDHWILKRKGFQTGLTSSSREKVSTCKRDSLITFRQ